MAMSDDRTEYPNMFEDIVDMEEEEYLKTYDELDTLMRRIPPVEYLMTKEGVRVVVSFPDPRRMCTVEQMRAGENYPYGISPVAIRVSLECPFCWGGDLSMETLRLAYSWGIFPWVDFRRAREEGDLEWFCPLRRFVIFPDKIHVSHSLRTLLNKGRYRVSHNEMFPEVIEACSKVDSRYDQAGAWLGEEIIEAYTKLWRSGLARSVEVRDTWDNDRVVGGLYGVWINGCFIGESMFSYVPSASKIAMVGLAEWMRGNGGKLIDCQMETHHHKSMGGERISWPDYLRHLNPEGYLMLRRHCARPLDISAPYAILRKSADDFTE